MTNVFFLLHEWREAVRNRFVLNTSLSCVGGGRSGARCPWAMGSDGRLMTTGLVQKENACMACSIPLPEGVSCLPKARHCPPLLSPGNVGGTLHCPWGSSLCDSLTLPFLSEEGGEKVAQSGKGHLASNGKLPFLADSLGELKSHCLWN